jgi:hypothetical protein
VKRPERRTAATLHDGSASARTCARETPEEYRLRFASIAENPDYVRGTVVRLEEEEIDDAYDRWATVQR